MFPLKISSILKNISIPQVISRCSKLNIHITPALSVKEVVVKEEGDNKIIEGICKESSRVPYLIKTPHDEKACPVCRLNLDIKHTDVLILSQFVREDGCMLPRRVTGLCKLSQKRMSSLVSMAHIAGLMPNLVPKYSKPNSHKRRRDWKKNNTYFHESTIKFKDHVPFKEKANYYKELGLEWDKAPWKNRQQIDLNTKKLKVY